MQRGAHVHTLCLHSLSVLQNLPRSFFDACDSPKGARRIATPLPAPQIQCGRVEDIHAQQTVRAARWLLDVALSTIEKHGQCYSSSQPSDNSTTLCCTVASALIRRSTHPRQLLLAKHIKRKRDMQNAEQRLLLLVALIYAVIPQSTTPTLNKNRRSRPRMKKAQKKKHRKPYMSQKQGRIRHHIAIQQPKPGF